MSREAHPVSRRQGSTIKGSKQRLQTGGVAQDTGHDLEMSRLSRCQQTGKPKTGGPRSGDLSTLPPTPRSLFSNLSALAAAVSISMAAAEKSSTGVLSAPPCVGCDSLCLAFTPFPFSSLSPYFLRDLFILCVWILYTCTDIHHVFAWYPLRSERVLDAQERVIDSHELSCGCCQSSLGPLQEQLVF